MHPRHQRPEPSEISGASARLTNMPRLAAPSSVKALTERSLSTAEDEAYAALRALGPTAAESRQSESPGFPMASMPRADRHTHSLGYGIDE